MEKTQTITATLNKLILHLYHCIQYPQEWPAFLRQVALAANADSVTMRWFDRNDLSLRHSYSYGLNPDTCAELIKLDPFMPSLCQQKIGQSLSSHTFISDEQYEQTDHYEVFFQPQDRFYAMGVMLSNGPDYNNYMGIHRSRSRGHFGNTEEILLNLLAPHLQQALELQNRIHKLRCNNRQLQEALGSLSTGVWLLDQNERVDWMNLAGHSILKKGFHGMCQGFDQRLIFDTKNSEVSVQLRQFMNSDHQHARLAFPDTDAVLLLNTIEDPLSADLPPGITHKQYLAILLDPNRPIVVDQNTLAKIYQLTASESRLVQTLLKGYDTNESADRLCLSPHTVRSQLKVIFSKTGTHRQSELLQKMTLLSIHK